MPQTMHLLFASTTASSVDLALLILRVTVGAVFLAHGINHIIGGGRCRARPDGSSRSACAPASSMPGRRASRRSPRAALLVLGLLTPIGGAGVVGVMLVAWITNHLRNGFFIFRPGEGWEYVMVLTFSAVAIATLGPGQWSIDGHVSALQNLWGWPGFWIAVGAGGLGAAGLLAVYWRPAPKPSRPPGLSGATD